MSNVAPEHKKPEYLHTFARAVAAALGWTYDEVQNAPRKSEGCGSLAGQTFYELRGCAYIVGPEGESVYLYLDAYRGRISAKPECYADIGGKRVEVVPYKFKVLERGCSAGTRPDVFARALKTHGVLSCALEAHTHALKRIAEYSESASDQARALDLLSQVQGVDVRKRDDTEATLYFEGGDGRVSHGNVRLELRSLDADTACVVIRTIARMLQGDR